MTHPSICAIKVYGDHIVTVNLRNVHGNIVCFMLLMFYISCVLYLLWLKNIPPTIYTPKFDIFSWAHLNISLQNMMWSQLAMFSFV